MNSKPADLEEVNLEELAETNQLFTNVSNLLETSTISADKVELIKFPKDSILPTGFRFIYSSIFFIDLPKLLDNKYSEASRH